jgi:NAD(P)-dependent dehydrogenase (short-subunit alcohol dehydrogenase family)
VLLIDRLEEELQATCAALQAAGGEVRSLACDLTEAGAVAAAVQEILDWTGRLDVLVNNAGISLPQPGSAAPDADSEAYWRRTLAVNLDVPFQLIRAAAEPMKNQGGGSIINITSLNSELAFPDNPAYMASKGGLRQLTRSFALDLAPHHIRVNNIGPGYLHTAMTDGSYNDPERHRQRAERVPLGRWGQPEDLQGAAVFLASDAAAYVTGVDLYVDGGWLIKGL